MGKKPIVSVTYENERISIKKQLTLLKMCVTSLLCGPRADLWPFYGFLVNLYIERKPFTQKPIKLWSAICFKIMRRYTCSFFPRILAIIPATRYTCVFLSRILAFYSQVYDYFLTNAHIYAHKKPIYMRYKQACGTVTEGRRIRGTELYRQQKKPLHVRWS